MEFQNRTLRVRKSLKFTKEYNLTIERIIKVRILKVYKNISLIEGHYKSRSLRVQKQNFAL